MSERVSQPVYSGPVPQRPTSPTITEQPGTVYAAFADAAMAEKAAGALLDYGARQEDISLVANDAYARERASAVGRVSTTSNGVVASEIEAPAAVDPNAPGTANLEHQAQAGHYYHRGIEDDRDIPAPNRPDAAELERDAKSGISTTTPADAGAGAAKGAGIGLGLGIAGGVLTLLIPGVGFVLGGGALALAIGAALGTTAGGAIAGGVVGYLKDQGMADEPARAYAGAIENGGAVLAIRLPSGKVDRAAAHDILAKYGAQNVGAF